MNCGDFFFSDGRCFSQSLFPLRMCQFTPERNSCTWKSGSCIDVSCIPYSWQHMSGQAFPTHQHRFLGARLCRHPATRVPQVFIIQTTVFLYSVFWSRGGAEVCVWCFGHAQLPSPSVTAPHQTCPCQTPHPHPISPTAMSYSAVHTKTSVVLHFFDYTHN